MLCGMLNTSGGSARELSALSRLRQLPLACELTLCGPLAVASGGGFAEAGEADGVTCLIDGRLHNAEAIAARHGFASRSVPDLLARCYRRSGVPLLRALRGGFSLLVWDGARRQGLLGCDLLSTRSMLLWRGTGWLAFASELGDLLEIIPSRPGPDRDGLLLWLTEGRCPADRTLYEGVSRLGPGELVELHSRGTSIRRYWSPRYTGTIPARRQELAEGLREQLERSTAPRVARGPTGVVLSGGLDSSIVAATASRLAPADARLRTYSAVFPGAEFDEREKVECLAQELDFEAAAFELEPQGTIWLALQHTRRWQLPLMGAGALIDVVAVTQAARGGAGVVLDGQTGDEVLGFSPFLLADRMARGRWLSALRLMCQWPIGRATTWRERAWILKNVGLKGAVPYRVGRAVYEHRYAEAGPRWLLPAGRRRYAQLEDAWAWKRSASGPRWWRYLADTLVQGPHRELRLDYLRHRAAAVGTWNESPLHDVDLITYCLTLPPELAFDWRVNRPLAREAMRGILPETVRLQPRKAVFSPFCFRAIVGADSAPIERLLLAPDAQLRAWVDMERVRRLWHEHRPDVSRSMGWGSLMWKLAATEGWLRLQSDPAFLDRMLDDPATPAPSVRVVPLRDRRGAQPDWSLHPLQPASAGVR
jgi:asparagine synthase (glutamine-hydrolysing)